MPAEWVGDASDRITWGDDGSVDPEREVVDVGDLSVACLESPTAPDMVAWCPVLYQSAADGAKNVFCLHESLQSFDTLCIVNLRVALYMSCGFMYATFHVVRLVKPNVPDGTAETLPCFPFRGQLARCVDRWAQDQAHDGAAHYPVWFKSGN
jgi:hypothetical protein